MGRRTGLTTALLMLAALLLLLLAAQRLVQTSSPAEVEAFSRRRVVEEVPRSYRARAARARGGSVANDRVSESRRREVKDAMRHAWSGYRKFAFGEDELEPVTRTGRNDFGRLGATAIDAIDTLWIMGLDEEYQEAREVVANFTNKIMDASPLSTFECIIRVLGGFLSVYYLTGDDLYLDNARELGDRLLPTFDASGNQVGMPYGKINLRTGASLWGEQHLLAEFGSTQLEFYALSRETGNETYAMAAARPLAAVHNLYPNQFLLPTHFAYDGITIGGPGERYTMGGMADSYYEYLLKCWVQGGTRRGDMVLDTGRRWVRAMDAMIEHLVINRHHDGLISLANVRGWFDQRVHNSAMASRGLDTEMGHLSCFVPGMLALGVHKGKEGLLSFEKRLEYLEVAEEIMRTCYSMYTSTPTGLAGENYVPFLHRMVVKDGRSMLRPETVESLMILHRVTGKAKYREWGWEIFGAIQRHCRVAGGGYSGVTDVMTQASVVELDNQMQSFFLAETLKYLFLLFSPKDVLSLDEWVFNTEAHPLLIWS